MDRLLVPLEEAMHQLGIGRTKLYELFDKNEIVRVNVGRRSLVLAESITAYVDRLSQTASAHADRDEPQSAQRATVESAPVTPLRD